ncbi:MULTISPECIES: 2-oxo acid dehydrogenase subunit E2 [unclassified Achromobacter]|uniref:2-oxo acid dehydrogenase subunit E2 n=1 Tax=unclassified Achromobacter TaxID=2626865 RepID=UPI000B51DBB4|nr:MULTISPECIES: 2-oxo acid dehydrogenase subunit E2 [unclassified Achromobacter]OWT80684.1 pyruvate dehydrogenase complex dihydrolipoamide acetyltransferase [Achromobacter sp. HZ34]OWT81200.1 pyruvate dehydrogenase complex dihydrolipoamide acetyltransferase [Achromobacter sp. HZ28]
MPTLIRMPEISANAAAAQLVEWLVEEGATVAADDVVASIETDKAVVDLNAGAAGTLFRRLAKAGEQVAVGAAVGVVLEQGESADAVDVLLAQDGKKPAALNGAAAPPAAPAKPSAQVPAPQAPERSFASPLARKLARQAGIALEDLHGSGPGGRVVRRDIERAQVARDAAVNAAFESIPHTPMRATIARRLTESKQHVPHFYVRGKCRMEALYALREQINHGQGKAGGGGHSQGRADEGGHAQGSAGDSGHAHAPDQAGRAHHGAEPAPRKFSVNDFIIKAAACTLRDLPDTNVIWTDSAMQRYRQVDISVAVAIPGGLITPVLHAVDAMSLSQLSTTMGELASRARESRLLPHEYQGGTFSISNLGMYGVTEFAAIINPPQSAILAVGASNRVPVVQTDGSLDTGVVMEYTLSVDHRAIDGALAAKWLARFQHYMEHPATMLV